MNIGLDRARILIEALPYIQKFNGQTIVVKYGGHAMVDSRLKKDFAWETRNSTNYFESNFCISCNHSASDNS